MLILILIEVQYSQNAVFSFELPKSLLVRFSLPGKKISSRKITENAMHGFPNSSKMLEVGRGGGGRGQNLHHPQPLTAIWKNLHCVFDLEERSVGAHCWTLLTLPNWEKQPSQVFSKNAALKNFAIFTGKHLCKIFKNTCFEEYLHTAASERTLWSDIFVSGSHFKASWLGNIIRKYQPLSNQSFK